MPIPGRSLLPPSTRVNWKMIITLSIMMMIGVVRGERIEGGNGTTMTMGTCRLRGVCGEVSQDYVKGGYSPILERVNSPRTPTFLYQTTTDFLLIHLWIPLGANRSAQSNDHSLCWSLRSDPTHKRNDETENGRILSHVHRWDHAICKKMIFIGCLPTHR